MRIGSRTQVCSALAVVAAIGLAIACSMHHEATAHARARAHADAPAPPAIAKTTPAYVAAPPSGEEEAPAKPSSLDGTDEDGALRVDARGDLVVGPDVLRLFEYWFAATGEESTATIRRRIVRAIERRLDGPAAAKALDLLDRFIAYREAARGLAGRDGDDLEARLERLKRLRRAHFGADADALFGRDELVDGVAIEKRRVARDAALGDEQRARRMAALDARLPETYRAARAAATAPLRDRDEERAMRAEGASDEEIQRRRVATLGEAAAERLQRLDERRAEWKRRVAAFEAAREAVGSDPAAVERLLEASFTPEEHLRVR